MSNRISRRMSKATSRCACPVFESLEDRRLMTASPYLVPTAPGVEITSILSAGDSVGTNGYRMAGTPDGLGAFDNGDGTFTVLMNHEFTLTEGVAHAHNQSLGAAGKGSYVDRLVIRKSDLKVLSGGDQIKTILDGATFQPLTGTALNVSRFCSADLAAPSAYFNAATGKGTAARIYLNGEETTGGRAFAHVVSGPNNGVSYTLPLMGGAPWENLLANPATGDTTLVAGNADVAGGKIYFYVGTKQSIGNDVERAGLTNGIEYQLAVDGTALESRLNALGTSAPSYSSTFTLTSGAGTGFLRPEDGAWDPSHPNDYYFVTTDQYDQVKDGIGTQVGRTRLWKLHFTDLANPTAGGTIEAVLDGTEAGNMFDNVTIDREGHVTMLEDVGNQQHNGKVFSYDIATDTLTQIAKHDPARFGDIGVPATAPFNQDEETSGVIDVSDILGKGKYLIDDQAHYQFGDPAIVEGGQLMLLDTNVASASAAGGMLTITGTLNNDELNVSRHGQALTVTFNGQTIGTFDNKAINSINLQGLAGNDVLSIDQDVHAPALVDGGAGDDTIFAGGASSILIGGLGKDQVNGGSGEDILVGGSTSLDGAALAGVLNTWSGKGNFASRVDRLKPVFEGQIIDDGAIDFLQGAGGQDWILGG